MNPGLLERLVCPRDGLEFEANGHSLTCAGGHTYPVVCGIPVLLLPEATATHWTMPRAIALAAATEPERALDPDVWERRHGLNAYVQKWLVKTCGNLYRPLRNHAQVYPIPELRLPPGQGAPLLEVGCNWGRWVVAAARLGYRAIGVDPSLEALVAAKMVCQDLGVTADFVAADARHLPFRSASLPNLYSYSVVQHLSRADAHDSLAEMGRVLARPGTCLVQMPNRYGVRCLYHQARRGFREGERFEVRYWSIPELRRAFNRAIGEPRVTVDGFFGLGVQVADLALLPTFERTVVRGSEVLRQASQRVPILTWVADSVFLEVRREAAKNVSP